MHCEPLEPCTWRPASADEIAHAVRPEQLPDNFDMVTGASTTPEVNTSCDSGFKHSCLGQCRGPLNRRFSVHRIPMASRSDLTKVCTTQANFTAMGARASGDMRPPLRALIEEAVRPPHCRLSFVGDSTVHDVWSAAISALLTADWGWDLAACYFLAGHGMWHHAETERFCGSNTASPNVTQLLSATEFSVASIFQSWARFRRRSPPHDTAVECASVDVHYWEAGFFFKEAKWTMNLARPTAPRVLNVSSLVILSIGTHANSLAELHGIWSRDVLPYLVWANQTSVDTYGTTTASATAVPAIYWSPNTTHLPTAAPGSVPRVLWIDTLPQHFNTSSGDGLHAHRIEGHLDASHPRPTCVPTDHKAASWRNAAFDAWIARVRPSAPRTPDNYTERHAAVGRRGTWNTRRWVEVPTADIFMDRWDLHSWFTEHSRGPKADCTHYCYTPFLYEPVWSRIERATRCVDRTPKIRR